MGAGQITIRARDEASPLLRECTDLIKKLGKRAIEFDGLAADLIAVDSEARPAPRTNELLVRFKPSQRLLGFAAALRALDRNVGVGADSGHGNSSPAGCVATASIEGRGGAVMGAVPRHAAAPPAAQAKSVRLSRKDGAKVRAALKRLGTARRANGKG